MDRRSVFHRRNERGGEQLGERPQQNFGAERLGEKRRGSGSADPCNLSRVDRLSAHGVDPHVRVDLTQLRVVGQFEPPPNSEMSDAPSMIGIIMSVSTAAMCAFS